VPKACFMRPAAANPSPGTALPEPSSIMRGSAGRWFRCPAPRFGRAARRPAYSVLDCSETESRLGAIADWRADLAAFFASAGNGVDD